MFTNAWWLVVGLGLGLDASVWVVSGYAHVSMLLKVVTVTPPAQRHYAVYSIIIVTIIINTTNIIITIKSTSDTCRHLLHTGPHACDSYSWRRTRIALLRTLSALLSTVTSSLPSRLHDDAVTSSAGALAIGAEIMKCNWVTITRTTNVPMLSVTGPQRLGHRICIVAWNVVNISLRGGSKNHRQ